MTHIPGTGITSNQMEKESTFSEQKGKDTPSTILSVVNVRELKKPKLERPNEEGAYWYNKAWVWVLFGGFTSLFFVILALINIRFLFLIPLGPIIGLFSWGIRKYVRKYDDATKGLFRHS